MGNRDEWKKLRQSLEAQGLRVELNKRSRWKVYRGSAYITTLPCTPSDHRGIRNKLSELRKRGVEV